jgi:preprotein translocase subunit SecE
MAQERMTTRVQTGVQALWGRVAHFFREVRGEFKKVSWSSRAELVALTILVLTMVIFVAIYLFAVDTVFRRAVEWLVGR